MKTVWSFIGVLLLFLSSCKKEDPICPPTPPNYMPLDIGNYWVYETFRVDTNGTELMLNFHDSMVVTGDTIINNETYAKIEGTYGPFHRQWGIVGILKYEDGNLTTPNGDTVFAANDFTKIFREQYEIIGNNDTLYHRSFRMFDHNYDVTVPAGTFPILDFMGTYTYFQNIPGVPNPRLVHNYYAENVGKVKSTYFYMSSPSIFEIRLMDYHVHLPD